MGFFKRLTGLFSPRSRSYDPNYWIAVQCNRCGEIIRARVDLRNDLSIDYDPEGGQGTTYFCRKVLMGEKMCFQKIEVQLTFDSDHKLTGREISGGQFIEEPVES